MEFVELAKALAAIAVEKYFSSDPVAQQSYTFHIDRIAVAINKEYLLQEVYWVLRVLPNLQTKRARSLAEKIDREKLAKEVEALIAIPQYMVNDVASRIAAIAMRLTGEALGKPTVP